VGFLLLQLQLSVSPSELELEEMRGVEAAVSEVDGFLELLD
jgi:hypothetical protein